jgi:CRISPR-associated endonuclease/helicase Cas3
VIPYLSIIEQTASVFKGIFNSPNNNDIILEHHSNIVMPDDDQERNLRKLVASRWDKPIIITTMVQFLETVMSAYGSNLRKFHNMQDAVIIFDEIQSLPTKSIHLFNEVISFLSKILNSTILLCTATQPLLAKTERKNLLLSEEPNLIDWVEDKSKESQRVKIIIEKEYKNLDEFSQFVFDKAEENERVLVIVNTKKVASNVYQKVKAKISSADDKFEIYHLSTAMCSMHRFCVLNKIKKCLKEERKCICISTQLIEAGVDISFPCVIRSLAGLDSIAQAAGRCNRNGESSEPKYVYIVSLRDEKIDKLHDIRIGKETADRIINENINNSETNEYIDYLSKQILDTYYEYYFHQQKNIMDFPVDNYSVYEMLSSNELGKGNYRNRTGKDFNHCLSHCFSSASDAFSVIDNKKQQVVVFYGEAENLIEQYEKTFSLKEKINIIKKLEKLSVSLYGDCQKLLEKGIIFKLDKKYDEFGIMVLHKNYSEEVGVTLEENLDDFIN